MLLEGLQPLFILLDEGQDRRLGGRRYLAPEFNRDRQNRRHATIVRPLEARTSSGCERVPLSQGGTALSTAQTLVGASSCVRLRKVAWKRGIPQVFGTLRGSSAEELRKANWPRTTGNALR